MRLVYLINTLGAGGAERHLLQLACDMMRRGHEVSVVVMRRKILGGATDLEPDFIEAGIRVIHLRSWLLGDAGRWMCLAKILGRLNPDVLHSHLPRSDLAAAVAKRVFPRMRWISTLHDAYASDKYAGYWIFPYVKWNWRRGDYFVAVSNSARDWGIKTLDLPADRTAVIYHGIQMDDAPLPAKSPDSGWYTIGCLARFEKRKGMETLVRAMPGIRRRFPEAKLLLGGSDPTGHAASIRSLAASLGVSDAVELIGFCQDPLGFMRQLDVFAFASTSEGFGIVLIEAMSVGCPIVGSDIYPINHIVRHGETGLLARPEDADAFAAAIGELLSDPARRHAMGEAGRRRCAQEFSLEQSLNRVHDIYLGLAQPAGADGFTAAAKKPGPASHG